MTDLSDDDRCQASVPSPPEETRATITDAQRDRLYDEFQPLVRRLVRQYGEDPELRLDLEGEIYCRFCRLVEAFEPDRGIPLKAYLVRTLPPSVYSFARTRWRDERRESSLEEETVGLEATYSTNPTAEWDERLATAALLRELPAAIARLPLRQRQVVIWRYYEGRSFETIAETLDVRPATARSLLRHGLNNLRRQALPCPSDGEPTGRLVARR
jgi:RNA polymerase sigma factor (sigma-70 family)